jgi:hypothetical protein
VAQSTSVPPTFNIGGTCNQLKVELKRVHDEQKTETRDIQMLVDNLVNNVRRLPHENVADILRFIFYPFGMRTLDHASQVQHTLT